MTRRIADIRAASRRRVSVPALVLFAAAALGGVGARLIAIEGSVVYDDELWAPLSGHRADTAARRAGAAFHDTQAFWTKRFSRELGRAYSPAELIYFSRLTESPCAGSSLAAGSFYCESTQVASLDLAFLDLMARRMFHEGEAGAALLVGRVVAGHVRREVGSAASAPAEVPRLSRREDRARDLAAALEADCLTGLWARRSAPVVGSSGPVFYARMIEAARLTDREIARGRSTPAAEPDRTLLGPGGVSERAAAFEKGWRADTIAECL